MTRVYLSSTYSDLKEQREVVDHTLRKMGYEVIGMEQYVAADERPLTKCLHDVATCDAYIGLFAWRYGYIPVQDNPERLSITELEYRTAKVQGKPCIIFLLHEDARWPRSLMDKVPKEGEHQLAIEQLRHYLQTEHLVSFFQDTSDLAALIGPAMYRWEQSRQSPEQSSAQQHEQTAQRQRLQMKLVDHSSFLNNRLESFVGRATELAEVQERIQRLLPTGGYVTITGQAGQGKSSIIAKLVALRGVEETAFHFIRLKPGPEHQVGLLRSLLARLILKYQLTELYVASDNRAALCEAFFAVLREIAEQGGQEVIFVDGLDQLEEEHNGERDLSFFPANPPVGIVLVLGTRPNDTLRPLELLKPRYEYPLPDLSLTDFKLILQHRQVTLNENQVARLYRAMEQNALFLDLLARELHEHEGQSLEAVIASLTDNPERLFSVAMDRLKRQWLWKEIIKPVLAVLLVAQEPLSRRQMRGILNVDLDDLARGLKLLGGFVIVDEQYRYSLYHLKFRDFLAEDPNKPLKEPLFAQDEVERWHQRLAQWCEGRDLADIWLECPHDPMEQERRLYARRHVLAHLYHARQWQRLCAILDAGAFGRAKIQWDSSMRSYALDLAWGERAASWEGYSLQQGIDHLAQLWRYSLLRCHLASRADSYPDDAFEAMILLGQTVKAVGIAELLTVPKRKVRILQLMAQVLSQLDDRQQEAAQLVKRAQVVASLLEQPVDRVEGLAQTSKSGPAPTAGQKVEGVTAVENEEKRAEDVLAIVKSLVQQQRWQEVEQLIVTIESEGRRARALCMWAVGLFAAGKHEEAQQVWQDAERTIKAIENEERRAALWGTYVESLAQGQQWQKAERLVTTIENDGRRVRVLSALAVSLFAAGSRDQAQQTWRNAESIIATIENNDRRAHAWQVFIESLRQTQQLQEVERLLATIQETDRQAAIAKTFAMRLTQTQQQQAVVSPVTTVEKDAGRAESLNMSLKNLLQTQQWEEAERIIATIEGDGKRAEAQSALAESLVQASKYALEQQAWARAERLISAIQNHARQVEALLALAEGLSRAGKHEEAQRAWWKAEQRIITFESDSKRSAALKMLVRSLAQMRQWREAERVAGRLENDDRRASALSALAKGLAQERQWEEAQRIIAMIEKEDRRAEALSALAKWLARADKYDQAQRAWEKAEHTIATMWDRNDHDEVLNAFATHLQQMQQWEETSCAIASIQGQYTRVKALTTLAERLVQVGRREMAQRAWQEAGQIIAGIEDERKRSEASKTLLRSLAQTQHWQEAERLIAAINNPYRQAEALSIVVESLLQTQHWQEAERIIATIKNSTIQASAWCALVESLAQGGQLQEAERIIATATMWNNYWKATAWCAFAKGLAQAGRREAARHAWRKAERIIASLGGGYIQNRDRRIAALSILAESLAQEGQLQEAERIIASLEHEERRASALNALAKSLAQEGQWQEAERIIASIADRDKRAEALHSLSRSLVQGSEQLIAQQAWSEAERTITRIQDTYWRARLLSSLAAQQAQAGASEQAQRAWQEAERLIVSLENDERRASALGALAESLAQGRQWEEAERIIATVRDPYRRVKALSGVAAQQAQAVPHERAQRAWQEAERITASMTDRDRRAFALQALTESLAQANKQDAMLRIIQHAWKSTLTEHEAFALLPLAFTFLDTSPTLGKQLLAAMQWVDTFLHS